MFVASTGNDFQGCLLSSLCSVPTFDICDVWCYFDARALTETSLQDKNDSSLFDYRSYGYFKLAIRNRPGCCVRYPKYPSNRVESSQDIRIKPRCFSGNWCCPSRVGIVLTILNFS